VGYAGRRVFHQKLNELNRLLTIG